MNLLALMRQLEKRLNHILKAGFYYIISRAMTKIIITLINSVLTAILIICNNCN